MCFLRQLHVKVQILPGADRLVPVLDPTILEIGFNFLSEMLWHRLVVVELLENKEEFHEIVAAIQIVIKAFECIDNFNKITHDYGEYSYSADEHEGASEALQIAYWVKVAEADGRHRGEHVVGHDDHLLLVGHLIDIITGHKI